MLPALSAGGHSSLEAVAWDDLGLALAGSKDTLG